MRIENKSNEEKLLNFHLSLHRKTKKKQWRAKAKQNHLNLLLNVCLIIKFSQEYNLKQNCALLTLPETQGYNKIRRWHDVDILCWIVGPLSKVANSWMWMNEKLNKFQHNWFWCRWCGIFFSFGLHKNSHWWNCKIYGCVQRKLRSEKTLNLRIFSK